VHGLRGRRLEGVVEEVFLVTTLPRRDGRGETSWLGLEGMVVWRRMMAFIVEVRHGHGHAGGGLGRG